MNDDPPTPHSSNPEDGNEQQEAADFMQEFDRGLAGTTAPARSGSTVSFTVNAARSAGAGLSDATLGKSRERVRQVLQEKAAPAAMRAERGGSPPAQNPIPLTSVLFSRLLARLGLGVLDVVVLLIVILIGSQILGTLLKKSDTKPHELAKKADEHATHESGSDEKAESPVKTDDPNWLDDLSADRTTAEVEHFIVNNGRHQSVLSLIGESQNANRDIFLRRDLIRYLESRVTAPATTAAEREAVGSAMLKLVNDKQAPTLLRKSAVRALLSAAASNATTKEQALPALAALANSKETSPLRAEALDALITLDPARSDIIAAITSDADSIEQAQCLLALSTSLMKSPNAAAHIPEATVQALVGVLQHLNSEADARIHAAAALAHAIRQGNATARAAGLPAIIKAMETTQDSEIIIGMCSAAEIIADPDLMPALKKTYADYLDKKDQNKEADTRVRIAVIKAARALLVRESRTKTVPTESDLAAVKDAATLLVSVVDDDSFEDCKKEAMRGLRYLYNPAYKALQRDAVESMIFFLKDKKTESYSRAREAAVESLESISSMEFGEDAAKWIKWFDQNYPKKTDR
jgi:hypothetical protein